MRIIASILFLAMGITNLVCITSHMVYVRIRINESQTTRRRLPPTTLSGGLFNAKQFRSPAFTVYTASGFFSFLGLYTG